MVKVFLDWGKYYSVAFVSGSDDIGVVVCSVEAMPFQPTEVYMEKGCPHKALYNLIRQGHKIFQVEGQVISEARETLSLEKSHIQDAWLLAVVQEARPDVFERLSEPDTKQIELRYLMGRYDKITKILAMFKNQKIAYEKEFGNFDTFGEIIDRLEYEKERLTAEAFLLARDEYEKVGHIKGLGINTLSRLLAFAHPKDFHCLTAYLAYCGYRGGKMTKYHRGAKSMAWFMATGVIMHRDEEFYPLYLKCKEDIKERFPDYSKGKINDMAINRLATFLLKRIYRSLSGERP